MKSKAHRKRDRRGVAAVEAALLLPVIVAFVLMITVLGSNLNNYQLLQNSAQQGARTAVTLDNSNAEVIAAVMSSLPSFMDQEDISVRITKLFGNGGEDYEVQNLSENEQGELIKVTVEYSGGLGSQMMGEGAPTLSTSAVARREDLE